MKMEANIKKNITIVKSNSIEGRGLTREARMEPPIQAAYLRSMGELFGMTFTLRFCGKV